MPDQIEIKPGRELDIRIAELKTDQSRFTCRIDPTEHGRNGEPQFHWGYPHGHDFAPEYSTDDHIALSELETLPHIEFLFICRSHDRWSVNIISKPNHHFYLDLKSQFYPTKALAACEVIVAYYQRKRFFDFDPIETEEIAQNRQFSQIQHPVNDATERLIEPVEIW